MRWINMLMVIGFVIIGFVNMAGCAMNPKDVANQSQTMLDIYRQATTGGDEKSDKTDAVFADQQDLVSLQVTPEAPIQDSYTREAKTEIKLLFPRLPNPDILVYVYPHLATAAQVPVPGYTTAIPLYEKVHYALPADRVSPRWPNRYPVARKALERCY